jgi:co-chaperonin GroES (HSP10)
MEINIEPLEYRVLVLPDHVSKYHGDTKLVKKSSRDYDIDVRSQTKGTIAAVSDVAFSSEGLYGWKGKKPKVGDKVEYAMNAGQYYYIEDVLYRIMNDQDIIGILKE